MFGKFCAYFSLALFVLSGHALAQVAVQSNVLITQTQTALCPTSAPTDVRLSGSIAYTAGSTHDTGLVTLKARMGQSRLDMNLSSGTISELRVNGPDPTFQTYRNGAWKNEATHNSWIDANWFFPALSGIVQGSAGSYNLTPSATARVHQTWQIANQPQAATTLIQQLSATDYDLDPSTHLPTSMTFLTHPDENLNKAILVEIAFSDYRNVSGIMVPYHVQRFVNGTLQLDITISTVAINLGLPNSDFIAQ